ncbi:hypothetical protein [Pseudanabaena yagii]|uniref:Lipoprotein n=1 Tax=Pseudanabaena yagii GIHE-NHR1 TaxID=2722753 RepID=A0ABX1LZ01_9CYAN|nr:hypothetical protein [Pseudanabaena yagii]NMF60745.1 hypothetical protein [Pseudanabaena yagii GIHE-NHR1]
MLKNLQKNSTKVVRLSVLFGLSAVVTAACSFNISTATLEDVKTCTEAPENQPCASDISQFQNNTPKIFVTSNIKYAPEGTKIKIDWKYLGGESVKATDIDSITLETKSDTKFVYSYLTAPTNGWPDGNYEIVLSINTDNSKPIRKQFSISKPK